MTDLKQQKDLTDGKGWSQVLVESVKGTTKKITTKAQNVWGGIKATPKFIKKSFKKEE